MKSYKEKCIPWISGSKKYPNTCSCTDFAVAKGAAVRIDNNRIRRGTGSLALNRSWCVFLFGLGFYRLLNLYLFRNRTLTLYKCHSLGFRGKLFVFGRLGPLNDAFHNPPVCEDATCVAGNEAVVSYFLRTGSDISTSDEIGSFFLREEGFERGIGKPDNLFLAIGPGAVDAWFPADANGVVLCVGPCRSTGFFGRWKMWGGGGRASFGHIGDWGAREAEDEVEYASCCATRR
ncbi:hypothetical protein QBC38DRAFT_264923 [Podospora fimiseda]|uniref:Uncharacterized protein n=1 Tax=Podospora fimiseda TaxID=252190 RepID=A0AAN7GUV5_9PEZI|nr:hypothetical protein QBC38DRAFT_264923 [Podospora fimiseda]